MSTKKDTDEYPVCLDLATLPVTHNHVIGAIQPMSLDNIRGVLAVVRRLLETNEPHGTAFGEDEVNGLCCIIDNTFHALRFEQYYRAGSHDRAKSDNGNS